jgi:DNA-binding transcriptional regulator YdaS (Cro superfamily)
MTPETALAEAIRLVGGHKKLADKLVINRTAIYQWKVAPLDRAKAIEEATNGAITRADLRPDHFDPPAAPDATQSERAA